MKLKFANALSLALIMAMLFTSVGLADNVQNDVVAAGNGTMTAGSSTVVNYRITANNGDGQTGCNAADATPATVTINTPAGVTVDTSGTPGNQVTLTFTACDVFLPATFSSSTAGDYVITVSVADGGTGTYNTNPATFTLKVLAGTVAVKLAGGPASGLLSWTKFDSNTTCSGTGNSSSNDMINSLAFGSLAAVGGGQSIRMTAPTIAGYTFSGWSGAITSASNPVCVVGSSVNQQIIANYTSVPVVQNQTISFGPLANKTYGNADFNVSASASSGLPVSFAASGTCTVSGSTVHITGAGSCTITASQAGNASYNPAPNVSQSFTIARANATFSVTGYSVTYDGALHLATGSATGVFAESLSGLDLSATSHTDVGSYTDSWTFTDVSGNYNNGSGTVSSSISQASSSVTVNCPASVAYSGAAQTPCSAKATGAGGLDQPLSVDYLNNLNVGTATANASFAGDGNHTGNNGSATFEITKAPSVVTVTCPSSIVFNGAAQEPCTAKASSAGMSDVTLSVTYGANTNAGQASASANWGGDANHDGNSGSATFEITKAPSTVAVTCPSSVVFNGAAQEPCSAKATGVGMSDVSLAVTYSDNTNAGTATANASWGGDANHDGNTGLATFEIAKAPSTVTVTCPVSVVFNGTAQTPCTAEASGVAMSDVDVTASLGYSNNTNTGNATAQASWAGDANHDGNSASGGFEITKAPSSITVTCGGPYTYTGSAQTPCTAKASGVGMSDVDVTASLVYSNNVNAGNATAGASWDGDANHDGSTGSGGFEITKASSLITVTCGGPYTYTGVAQTPCTAKASGVGMSDVDVTASLVYSNNTNVGNATAQASWAGDTNHDGNTGTGGFTIEKADATCTVTGYNVIYDGNPHTASGSCVGVLNESLSGLNLAGTTHTAAGSYPNDPWSFTDATGNYKNTSGTVGDNIAFWTIRGFYQPVDMNNFLNTVKAGSTVPLKFEVFAGSAELTDPALIKTLTYAKYTCTNGTPEDAIETTATGGTVLRYDTTSGQFIYNWKTPTTLGCYQVVLTTQDGSTKTAFFKLK